MAHIVHICMHEQATNGLTMRTSAAVYLEESSVGSCLAGS